MTLSIKDHIDQGHYPTDDKGRALVPMRNGGTFTVTATDKPKTTYGEENGPKRRFIVGWDSKGIVDTHTEDSSDLLPPPPRKAPIKVGLLYTEQGWMVEFVNCGDQPARGTRVQLTGEYEEPWT